MVHGVVAGMILAEEIQENHHPWSDLYSPNRFSSLFTLESLKENIKTVGTLIKGKLLKQYEKDLKDIKVGQGKIIDLAGKKTAVYRDEKGKIFAVSAVCTHMGCIVGWNNAEKTWDCPCHGSRFNIDGSVIHGPAIKKLDRIDLDK
jgi:Rieske Fe-S protein